MRRTPARVASLRRLIDACTFEIDILAKRTAADLAGHRGYQAIQAIDGVGPLLAAVFVAEIGDVTRFARPQQQCSWAGMTAATEVEEDRQGHFTLLWIGLAGDVAALRTLNPPVIGSPTPGSTGVGSPSRVTIWCGGPRWRRCNACIADH